MDFIQSQKLIESKSPGSKLLFLTKRGSFVHGTNVESSDNDYAGVYIQPIESILLNDIIPSIGDSSDDIIFYEIGKFISMLSNSNPSALEIINIPNKFFIFKDEIFDLILNQKDIFLSKEIIKPLIRYATKHIKDNISPKKIMHYTRLLDIAHDILAFNTFKVFRENNLYLKSIRNNEVDINEIINKHQIRVEYINQLLNSSKLKDSVDQKIGKELILNIRKKLYNI